MWYSKGKIFGELNILNYQLLDIHFVFIIYVLPPPVNPRKEKSIKQHTMGAANAAAR